MKRVLASLAILAGALFGVQTAAAQTETKSFDGSYTVRVYGVSAGTLRLQVNINGDRYTASTSQRTTGLIRSAVGDRQDYDASARGVITASAVRPTYYRHQGGRRDRVVEVTYSAEDVVTTANPPMGMGNPPATREQRLGTTDQVSSFVHMMVAPGESDPCSRTIRVFDGRARFDLVMRPNGTQQVRNRAFRGTAQRCTVTYRPIAGFSDEPPQGDAMTFLFGRIDNGLWAPIRIEWPTEDVGTAVIELRSLTSG